ncbi:MAG: PIN domain-containing protein [Actinomycetes bacterium]
MRSLLVARTDADRIARQSVLQQVETDFDPIAFDARAARASGRVAAQLRASGRKTSACAYDTMEGLDTGQFWREATPIPDTNDRSYDPYGP